MKQRDVLTVVSSLAMAVTMAGSLATAQTNEGEPLIVRETVPDAENGILTIVGENFGNRPFVTLDLVPLRVEEANETEIVTAVPLLFMPRDEYWLTVSRGSGPNEHASLEVTLGTAGATAPSEDASSGDGPLTSSTFPDQDAVVARVGDRVITVAEVDREWRRSDPAGYVAAQRQTHDTRRQIADRLVAEELFAIEAAARGLTVEELLEQEIPSRIVTMPDAAVRSLYQGLGAAAGTTFQQMEPALRAWLREVTEPELARANYIEELMKVSTRVDMSLVAPRIEVERSVDDPVLGSEDAPIEIVTFGDFENPEYVRFAQAFPWVIETFADQIRIVFKHLPVPERRAAVEAALASRCAQAQNQFWAYHDILLAQQGIFDTLRFKQLAGDVGLDRNQFDACLDDGEHTEVIPEALSEAGRYAIQGSPTFLVNGRLVPPPPAFLPPTEFFTKVIEEELAAQGAQRP